jgi:hypothetical protein
MQKELLRALTHGLKDVAHVNGGPQHFRSWPVAAYQACPL